METNKISRNCFILTINMPKMEAQTESRHKFGFNGVRLLEDYQQNIDCKLFTV